MTAALLTAGCGIRMPASDDAGGPGAGAEAKRDGAKPGHGLPNAFVRIGDTAAQTGDYQTAAKFYRRAHESAPQQPEPLVRLAAALQSMESFGEAADAYRKALALDAANATARDGLNRSEAMLAGRPVAAPPAMGGPAPQLPDGIAPPARLTPPPGTRIPASASVETDAGDGFHADPYAARIGAYRTADAAAQARAEIRRVAGNALAGMQVAIDAIETEQGPVYWLKTASFGSYDVAADFCDALARRALPCVVDGLVAPAARDDGQMVAVEAEPATAEPMPVAHTPAVLYVKTEPRIEAAATAEPPARVAAAPTVTVVEATPATAAEPAAAPAVEAATARNGAWQVQLAAYRTHEAAVRASSRFVRAVPDLASATFDVQQIDFGAPRGLFHRLRVAASVDLADARALCETVVSRGYECMVVSAEPSPPATKPPADAPAEAQAPAATGAVAVAEAPAD
ncbi:MAG: tetratricopeptide repeat protein [Rhodospirillales bacterium]